MGRNGSGKSTLIKIMDSLLPLSEGSIVFEGKEIKSEEDIALSRKRIGISFQNPDAHFVSETLLDDVLFGLYSHGYDKAASLERAKEAIRRMGLEGFENRDPRSLSGGEKERAVIASLLVLSPKILIFDEVFSMLDRKCREDVKRVILSLRDEMGISIVLISHSAEDLLISDRIAVLDQGRIVRDESAHSVLSDTCFLREYGLLSTYSGSLSQELIRSGLTLDRVPLTPKEMGELLC